MARVLREVELSEPVRKWLEGRGYTAYAEVPFLYYTPDWVGMKGEQAVIVEMKVSLTKQVIRAAAVQQIYADLTYAAVKTNPMVKGLQSCKKHGVGVLTLRDGEMVEILQAQRFKGGPSGSWRKKLMERIGGLEPGGVAGKPTLAGEGPAIDCHARVQEYKAAHPKATWKEIFENVPNHYASPKSLAGSMAKVEFRRWWWEERKRRREQKDER